MTDSTRLDKWLWAARFFKTRSLATQAVKGGKVEINGERPKASRLVREGDRLRITKGEVVFEVEVIEIGVRRVSAPLAQQMYSETEASQKARVQKAEERRDTGSAPQRRPDKRQRRELRKFTRKD